MNKHTAGPWHLDDWGTIVESNNENVVITGVSLSSGNHPKIKEVIANRNLFLISPQLLETLEDMVYYSKQGIADSDTIYIAECLIAKAKGE